MTIEEANLLTMMPAMDVIVTVRESNDSPTSVTAYNYIESYEANARVLEEGSRTVLMDLGGDGFIANGNAQPANSEALSGSQKYGFISSECAKADGSFDNPLSVDIGADYEWEYLSVQLSDMDGNISYLEVEDPVWTSGVTTITIDEWTPYERVYLTSIALGKSWTFTNENLVKIDMSLRGVSTSLDEGSTDLGMSEVECQAYMGENADKFIEVFARMEKYSPCHVQVGYAEDSVDRTFYISEQVNYDAVTKVLTVKMADATIFLDGSSDGQWITGTTANSRQNFYNAIKQMLTSSGVPITESGSVPTGAGSEASNILIDTDTKRNIIAKACTLYSNPEKFALTYRDGGMPELIAGRSYNTWSIKEADVSELTREIEMRVKTFTQLLNTYTKNGTAEEVATVDGAEANKTYFVESSDPIAELTTWTSGCTAEIITPYKVKVVTTTAGDKKVNGYKINTTQESGTANRTGRGIEVDLGEFPKLYTGTAGQSTLPEGYTAVEWIGASGTQYINTGITLAYGDRVEVKYTITSKSAYKSIFGAYDGSKKAYFGMNSSSNYYLRLAAGDTAKVSTTKADLNDHTAIIDFVSGGSTLTLDGNVIATHTSASELPNYPCFLFADNDAGSVDGAISAKIRSFKIIRNDTPIANYVPCYNSSNVIGMYDTEGNQFLTNSGTGTFTKGADSSPVEYESLTLSGMYDLLNESNIKYEWTWRGNPHWQPYDRVDMEMMPTTPQEVIEPVHNLMVIEEVSYEFEGGGLKSVVKARGGEF